MKYIRKNGGHNHELQNFRLVKKTIMEKYDLSIADLELILNLAPHHYFIKKDFLDAAELYSWDKNRFPRLTKREWIVKWVDRKDINYKGHNKYRVSLKGKVMVNLFYDYLYGFKPLPKKLFEKKPGFLDKMIHKAILRMRKKDREDKFNSDDNN